MCMVENRVLDYTTERMSAASARSVYTNRHQMAKATRTYLNGAVGVRELRERK